MNDDRQSSSQPEDGEATPKRFPTVGIGTSAGGVHALQRFFEALPDDVDAAFVVVVHLDPAHQSELPSILAARTKMPVAQVVGRVRLEPGHVYVIPPNRQLTVTDQHLAIAEFDEPRWQRAPIDLFFRSLAAQRGDDFAIVLSGAGSDGAVGIKAVKEAGGIILVQDPDEAEYGSMPRAAVGTGLADFVLPVREIAARLPELIRNRGSIPTEMLSEADGEAMQRILSHLRVRTGHDFSNYKKSTVQRRIARRMQVQRTPTMAEYLTILRDSPAEAQALFADLLISVTTFFRDPSAFERLAALVMPKLFEDLGAAEPIRVWIPGCATGEEAYSIAILLLEEAARHEVRREIQVFASDLDDASLTVGREGRYPLAIEADMTEERLRRFFTRESDHYRVTREVRDLLLFAKHSLLKDPPFSRVDLISCRNVLIYLDRELQQQVCVTFHYALRPSGFLFLGSSENADSPVGMFRPIDREARIYRRVPLQSDARAMPRVSAPTFGVEPLPVRSPAPFRAPNEATVHREALERLAPPSAIVDESYRVIHLSETAGRYFQPSGGTLANDITELARTELRIDLRSALHRAFARNEVTLSGPIGVGFNGADRRVHIQVRPLSNDPSASRSAIVFFFEGDTLGDGSSAVGRIEEGAPVEQIQQLHQELQFAQSQLRTSREEFEGANEELRAANEELQSINEEYRSTAEELETSKEELQSINEELQTVNSELKSKLETVSRAHSDIQNLMAATDVGILFLDTRMHINRFTPRITELFNIASGDEGRAITDFTHTLDYDNLAKDARAVLRDLTSTEREVRSRDGNYYLMRLRPYRTTEDRIDGVVVTFVDIGERRRAVDALRENEARLRAVFDGVADAIVTVSDAGTIQSVNRAAIAIFGYPADELIGASVTVLVPEARRAQYKEYMETHLRGETGANLVADREVECLRKDGSTFPAELTVSSATHGQERLFIGFIRDLSERRRFEARLSKLHENRLASMAEMATSLAHEINQPLQVAASYLSIAQRRAGGNRDVVEAAEKASAQVVRAGRIVGHLREFVARREPDVTIQGLHGLIRRSAELTTPTAKQANVTIALRLDASQDRVLADNVQIEQALVNLIRNGIDAIGASSKRELTIVTSLVDGNIQTEVIDSGPGLALANESELFEPFTSTKPGGLGVGLSITRSIIEAHHGRIWAENIGDGGAKFTFTLPLGREGL